MLPTDQVLVAQGSRVPLADPPELAQRGKHLAVVGAIVRNEQIDVLGGPDEAIRDHREAADDDEPGAGADHRPGHNVELRAAG